MKKTNFKLSFVASWAVALSVFVGAGGAQHICARSMLLRADASGFRCYQLIKLENNAQSNAARYSFWGAAFAWTLIELQPCRLLAINPTQHD